MALFFGVESKPISVHFSGRNIHFNHVPAILGCIRYQGFDPDPYDSIGFRSQRDDKSKKGVQKGTSIYRHQFQRGTLLELTDFIDFIILGLKSPISTIIIDWKLGEYTSIIFYPTHHWLEIEKILLSSIWHQSMVWHLEVA